jgi:hypothetical protein
MKNKYTWLILGFVIGIIVCVAVCWFYCCNDSCKTACKEKCAHSCKMDSCGVKTISVDTAAAYFQCYMKDPDTVGVFKAYNINLEQLRAMNMIAMNDSTVAGFRIYPGVFGDPTDVTVVVGVTGSGTDNTTTIYTTSATGTGPCPTVCDGTSPITNPKK